MLLSPIEYKNSGRISSDGTHWFVDCCFEASSFGNLSVAIPPDVTVFDERVELGSMTRQAKCCLWFQGRCAKLNAKLPKKMFTEVTNPSIIFYSLCFHSATKRWQPCHTQPQEVTCRRNLDKWTKCVAFSDESLISLLRNNATSLSWGAK